MRFCLLAASLLVLLILEVRAQGVWRTQELCDCTPQSMVYDKLIKGFAVTHFHNGAPRYESSGRGSVWKEKRPGVWTSISDTATTNGPRTNADFGAISESRLVFVNGEDVYVSNDSGKTWLIGSRGPTGLLIHFFNADSGYKVIQSFVDSSVSYKMTFGSTVFFD